MAPSDHCHGMAFAIMGYEMTAEFLLFYTYGSSRAELLSLFVCENENGILRGNGAPERRLKLVAIRSLCLTMQYYCVEFVVQCC